MNMEDDWDLHAVVRGCAASSTTTTATSAATWPADLFHSFKPRQDDNFFSSQAQDQFFPRFDEAPTSSFEELHDLYKPFFTKSQKTTTNLFSPQSNIPISPLSVLGGLQDLTSSPQQQQQQQKQIHQLNTRLTQPTSTTSVSLGISHVNSPKTKRRKNQLKKVCQVPAEGLSSDMWSWRKYGQKPIKGSPYPRGYYRCSTSKGCLARKQVERNRSDPNMFIVTYTAEHNHPMPTHRNSLAGSCRQKPASSQNSNKTTASSPENQESGEKDETLEDEEEEEFGSDNNMGLTLENMEPDDDFFDGLEEIAAKAAGDCGFPATGQMTWLSNNVTTTAAGGC